jgi:anaerobic selenocysteine-containing dehydrogenase
LKDDVKIVKTTCGMCHGGCGALVYVEDGKAIKIEGDPESPITKGTMCAKGLASLQQLYHPDRLKYPLKRVGKRGEGKWERITWDEALRTIADKMNEAKEIYGPEAVGIVNGDPGHHMLEFVYRFGYTFGTPNTRFATPHICFSPPVMTSKITYGWPSGFHFEESNCIMLVGANFHHTNYAGNLARRLIEGLQRGPKLIVADPRLSPPAAKADLWLQVRPGTDCALFLGMLNVIVKEKLYDKDFIEKWTNAPLLVRKDTKELLRESDIQTGGDPKKFAVWDRSREQPSSYDPRTLEYEGEPSPALDGSYSLKLADGKSVECSTVWQLLTEYVEEYTPEKVEKITWVPADKIREASRMYATIKPACLAVGVSIEQNTGINTTNSIRTAWLLPAVTGNVDVAGGNILWESPIPQARLFEVSCRDRISPELWKKALGLYPLIYWPAVETDLWRALAADEPYPIKVLLIHGCNALVNHEHPQTAYEALKKVNFLAVMDLWMTPVAELADILLPANTYLERDEVYWIHSEIWTGTIFPCQRVVEPVGEGKWDIEVFIELAKVAGFDFGFNSNREYLDWLLKPTGMSFEKFKEKGPITKPQTFKKYEKGLLRPDGKKGFNTPSGKVELYSQILKEKGLDPLPVYKEPKESPVSTPELALKYPLILTSYRLPVYFHSQHRKLPWLREIVPEPLVQINSNTAKEYGIKDGDWVWIESPRGKCRRKAELTLGVHPKVICAPMGWWLPEKPGPEHGVLDVNINLLADNEPPYDPGFGSTQIKGLLCQISKA